VIRAIIWAAILGLAQAALAEDTGLIRAHTDLAYPEAMSKVQHAIREAGYSLSFIQPVDKGLQSRGIAAEPYRVLHVWDERTIEATLAAHPELAAQVPLRITLQAVEGRIEVSALRPTALATDPDGPAAGILARWEAALESIIAAVEHGE
jgi:uncharacterized protein (DUF302 family)